MGEVREREGGREEGVDGWRRRAGVREREGGRKSRNKTNMLKLKKMK